MSAWSTGAEMSAKISGPGRVAGLSCGAVCEDDPIETEVRLVPTGIGDKAVVRRLLELNAYELSRFDGADLNRHGTFGYPYLDHYWTEADRHPYVIDVRGALAGLVLIRAGGTRRSIAEFLVLPKYRRSGVGTAAARAAFSLFPGEWEIHELDGNDAAVAFWHRAIPVPFAEAVNANGTTQRFWI